MCGIVAVLPGRPGAPPPRVGELLSGVDAARAGIRPDVASLEGACAVLAGADARLRGVPGVLAMLADREGATRLARRLDETDAAVAALERRFDDELLFDGIEAEAANAALVRLKDALWALRHDRLPAATQVAALAGGLAGEAAVAAFWAVRVALRALERLEVRGRDSAGLHLLVTGHGLTPDDPEVAARSADPLFRSGSVRADGEALGFVYKAAAEVGELGDNIRVLEAAIAGDALLHRALAAGTAQVAVLGHTRWASVGVISEPNAHPLNSEEEGRTGPYVVGALNGDVDNHVALRAESGLRVAPEITTDAKVIPLLVSRRLARGIAAPDAFRHTVARFEGSVAVAAAVAAEPGRLLLGLRGSGQALYVGVADHAYVVASEPYGPIEETSRYLRMDGEATGGQVVVLDREQAGTLGGIDRVAYDGTPLPVGPSEIVSAEITTRDVDRRGFPHFFLKEISEAPLSLTKTLRGRIVDGEGLWGVRLGEEALPAEVRQRLAKGLVRRIFVIGQGTAAVAARSLGEALTQLLPTAEGIRVQAMPATELSGFGLDDDMSDALVVAVSQSGTTTDTNRTVDLARARGAAVVAIVNRRNSDLVEKADGVLYTSDGRDVEMSVPSSKAFYAQVAAGFLLAAAIAEAAGFADPRWVDELARGLRELPAAMEAVLARRTELAEAARAHAPRRRHWAVVGSGANRVAAEELRIKLSELAYKAVACDTIEDKKHIDLSSEPLIVVCAAGMPPAAAADVVKELAIYRAHRAAPVVIATDGAEFPPALATIGVPAVHPALAFVVSTMAGHLFGYEAALAIDGQARLLREARAAVEEALRSNGAGPHGPGDVLGQLAASLREPAQPVLAGIRAGDLDGSLEAGTAVRLASVLRFATGQLPLELFELEHGRPGTPQAVVDEVLGALTAGIEQLTRPIDAIKHQAKTVTVGVSRSEKAIFSAPLVVETLRTGAPKERLSYRALRTLVALGPAVERVTGYTRYRVDGSVEAGTATIHVLDKGGVAAELRSRAEAEAHPQLRGTKHRAATLREVTVARGLTDGRTVILVPEITRGEVVGLTLLHADFADRLPAPVARAVLEGYQARLSALADAVTETEAAFDDAVLEQVAVIDALTSPVYVLAEHWRRR